MGLRVLNTDRADHADRPDQTIQIHFTRIIRPLRAQKYLETAPTTQPTATYVIRVTTVAPGGAEAKHEIRLVDPGDTKPLNATYNDLAFEADRSVAGQLAGDFLKGSSPPPSATPRFGNDPDAAPFSPGP